MLASIIPKIVTMARSMYNTITSVIIFNKNVGLELFYNWLDFVHQQMIDEEMKQKALYQIPALLRANLSIATLFYRFAISIVTY